VPKMSHLIVRGGTIVTMNPRGDIVPDGSVVIQNDRIIDVSSKTKMDRKYPKGQVIDAKGMVVLPGLVNAHVHTVQSLLRGIADDSSLFEWLSNYILPMEEAMNKDDVRVSSLLGYAEMIKSGSTTCADLQSVHHVDEAMKAAKQIGMRARIAKTLMDEGDFPEGLIESPQEAVSDSVNILKKWHNEENGRIQFALAPRFIQSCSIELMKEVRHFADEHRVGIYTHAAENEMEAEEVKRKYKKRTLELLQEVGLTGIDVMLAHCIWLSENEHRILKKTKSNVIHCPSANMKLASGICEVPKLIRNRITVALGSDGAPCNNTLDIFREIRLAAFLGKVNTRDPKVIPARKALEMATLDGAKAMGLSNQIGSIEKEKKADIILIDFRKLHMTPIFDIISHLVYCCKGSDVNTVIIDGKVVLENTKLKFVEESEIRTKAQKHAEKLLDRVGAHKK
jgi:5-methylthioadenosine/S-adenosylhomocysteine deaminase